MPSLDALHHGSVAKRVDLGQKWAGGTSAATFRVVRGPGALCVRACVRMPIVNLTAVAVPVCVGRGDVQYLQIHHPRIERSIESAHVRIFRFRPSATPTAHTNPTLCNGPSCDQASAGTNLPRLGPVVKQQADHWLVAARRRQHKACAAVIVGAVGAHACNIHVNRK